MVSRAAGDQDVTAHVLLLQARLAALAAQQEDAVRLVQAAQAAGDLCMPHTSCNLTRSCVLLMKMV
jgi:hypothetical protein